MQHCGVHTFLFLCKRKTALLIYNVTTCQYYKNKKETAAATAKQVARVGGIPFRNPLQGLTDNFGPRPRQYPPRKSLRDVDA